MPMKNKSMKMSRPKQFQGSTMESFIILSKELLDNFNFQFGDQEVLLMKKQKGSFSNTQLLTKIYSIIISHRKDVFGSASSPRVKLNELEKIVWHSHILYKKRLFESANRLDRLIRTLRERGLLTHNCDVRVVLQFLSNLIDAGIYTNKESFLLSTAWKVPSVTSTRMDLPLQPLNYNDARLHYVPTSWYYTHFPSHLFDIEMPNSINGNCGLSFKLNRCQEEPGKGLQYDFFQIEEGNSDNCLGAMVGPKKSPISSDTALCIPDLPNVPVGYSFVPFFLSQYSDNLESSSDSTEVQISSSLTTRGTLDEGYESSQGSCEEKYSNCCDEIWETVLKSSPLPNHCTWESSGKTHAVRQNPFISEAGYETTYKLWAINSHHLSNFTTLFPNYPNHNVTSEMLCTNIIHLLMGIPSSFFFWNKKMKNFEVKEGIYCQGITPESLYLQIKRFLSCGNQIMCLEGFVNWIEQHPENEYGFVFRAFVFSIKNVICVYRKKVFSLLGEDKILALKLKMEKLISKIAFLYNICYSTVIKVDIPFKGLSLIGVLMNEFLLTRQKSNSFLLLSLLNASCEPFFRFLEKWIYEGELYDPSSEFMVSQNIEALQSKDRSYWLKGHYFNHAVVKESAEVFKNVLIQAFHCGKSLNFLRTFAPQNFWLLDRCIPFPKITLCMTINEVEITRKMCRNYFRQMENSNNCITLKEWDDLQGRKLHHLLRISRERLNLVSSHLLSGYHPTNSNIESEQKHKALQKIKSDIEQAKVWKALEEKRIQAEDLKTQKLYDKIQQEKEEEDSKMKNMLKNCHQHYMNYLEEREDYCRHRLKSFSVDIVDVTSAIVHEEESPLTSQCSYYIDTVSQMSIASDTLDTPIMDEMPDILEDNNVHEANEMDNFVYSVIERCDEVNNNPFIENLDGVELERIEETTFGVSLDSTLNNLETDKSSLRGNCVNADASLYGQDDYQRIKNFPVDSLNGNYNNFILDQDHSDAKSSNKSPENVFNTIQPCLHSETAKYFPDNKLFINEEDLSSNKFANIRKSKSDTFHVKSSDSDKRKGLQSSLSNLCESETPIIVDTTPYWDINDDLPKSRYTDKDLLSCREMELPNKLLPYSTIKFCLSDQDPLEDISILLMRDISNQTGQQTNVATETFFLPSAIPIATSTYLIQALSIHVSAQTRLVNETVLSYILINEKLIDHFSAIKSLILLDDISFARPLASGLYNKFPVSYCMSALCNPVNLNGLLHEAVAASQFAKSPFADNLSFVMTNMPSSSYSICNPLDHIHLHYQVNWPCCVILDDSVFNTYGKIWKFLIKLHYVIWTMDDIFKQIIFIDHDPLYNKIKTSIQYRKISLYRFEIHQFVGILFNYIVHQGIQCGWTNFQSNLRKNVTTLDELYAEHWDLLNNIIGKCFLTSQASIVHDILQSIFDKVISFRSILLSHSWMPNSATKQLEHPQFSSLQKTYQEIKQLSLFLNKLLLKILHWTYSDHLRDLVDQLSFNVNDQETPSIYNNLA